MVDCRCPWHLSANRFCPLQGLNLRMANDRLKTFTILDWPFLTNLSIVDYAEAGFYYTGTSDVVKCFTCKTSLHEWKENDSPSLEHAKYSPMCAFVRGQRVGNVPIIMNPYQDQPDSDFDFPCC